MGSSRLYALCIMQTLFEQSFESILNFYFQLYKPNLFGFLEILQIETLNHVAFKNLGLSPSSTPTKLFTVHGAHEAVLYVITIAI